MKKNKNIPMYIQYEHSYRRHGRRRRRKLFKTIFSTIIAFGIVYASYYTIMKQINLNKDKDDPDFLQTKYEGDGGNGQDLVIGQDSKDSGGSVASPTGVVLSEDQNNNDSNQGSVDNLDDIKEQNNQPDELPGNEQGYDGIGNHEVETRTAVEAKGVYVTSKAARSMINELINLADTTEINTMVIDIKDDNGKITYSMDSETAKEIGATTDAIPDMVKLLQNLKERNIYTIARIVAFKDPYLAEHKQELALRMENGSLYRDNNNQCWVNPYRKEVWEYLVEVASQAAAIGFDEIQFDYIRFSTGSGMLKVDFGEDAETKSKEDIILEFTKYAYESLKPLGVFVSADVYGTIISSSIDAGLIGQNYVEMAKYLDYICPMIYPSHFGEGNYGIEYPDLQPRDIVRKVLVASKEKLSAVPEGEHCAIVRPWLQDFTASWIEHYQVYEGPQVREQIDGLYDAGYKEWLLWNSVCTYSVEGLLVEN